MNLGMNSANFGSKIQPQFSAVDREAFTEKVWAETEKRYDNALVVLDGAEDSYRNSGNDYSNEEVPAARTIVEVAGRLAAAQTPYS